MMEQGRLVTSKYEATSYRLILSTMVACLGSFSFGLTIGYSSTAVPKMRKSFVVLVSDTEASWFTSLMTIGGLCGSPLAGWCIDRFGRKKTLLYLSLPYIIGWAGIAHLKIHIQETLFNLGRFLTGLAGGMVTVAVPVYITEISTSSTRGFLGSCNQLCITVGIVSSFWLGSMFQWDTLAQFGYFPPIISMIGILAIPETPRWLLMKKKRVSAAQALTVLRGPHTDVEEECKTLEESLEVQAKPFSFAEFKEPHLKKPLIICLTIMAFQQFSGINAVMFYTVNIFDAAGFDSKRNGGEPGIINSENATVLVGLVQVVATAIACCLMDRLGRCKLLNIGGSLMAFTTFMLGLYFYLDKHIPFVPSPDIFALLCVIIYIIGFSLGWGPVPMLIMSEIFPSRCRAPASALATFVNWLCAFIVTLEFLNFQAFLGVGGTFWLFSFSCVMSVVFILKYVPETKGRSLEEIELFFVQRR